METEIIKTDDPNVVIERTVSEREINISSINAQLTNFISNISLLDSEIEQLEQSKASLPEFIVKIVEEKIYNLLSEKATNSYQVELLNNEINKLNG